MGIYNPHAPYIIGNEWVPIRQANFSPDKVTEFGYTFRVDHSVVPITGAYYVAEVPQTRVNNVADLISVYPAGGEVLTGPIKQVNIPASAIWTTGAAMSHVTLAALHNPSDDQAIWFTGPSDFNTQLGISFDVTSYSQQLYGKRILDVSFRYSLAAHNISAIAEIATLVGYAKNMINNAYSLMFFSLEGTVANEPTEVNSFSLGSLNYFWDSTRDLYTLHDVYPWRYQELARFAATEPAPTRMILMLQNGMQQDSNAFIYYVEMQVTYCEETRILYGGRSTTSFQDPAGTVTQSNYGVGPNLVRLFNTSFVSNSTALTPGNYTVTLTHDNMPIDASVATPTVNAIRELYPVPPQSGVRVNKSLIVDETFTSEEIPVLTEITLHTSSAVVTGVHPYGDQDDIPVYGSITATQEIEDDPVGTSKSYPQVRFYARRFGETTVPLTIVDVATGLSTASITVAEFDALPEIVDGWKEVNLRFAVPPSFATAAGDVDWRWQATGETASNQWQVLGAGSRAFAAHSIGPASYYAPQGSTVTLTWQSPPISGVAEDTLSDAVLIFATDPPSVSGFAGTIETQELSGIAEGCVPNACIPTGIDYVELTWTALGASSVLVTGGSIELQRSDEVDETWHTIMRTEDLTTSTFQDFEARVGVSTLYRIRTVNVLDFAGSWVTGAAVSIPAPGVDVGGDGNSVLIFTTNEDPTSNLAYVMQWEGEPIETFAFPEADEVQLQRMYGKNYFTAFHPLERGGEQFTRTILVNAAAIPTPSLANVHDLRDLAWASVNYVCVRDELGNRWFANVRVPDDAVRLNRTVYMAQIQVSEVTGTPTPIAEVQVV